MVGYAPEACHRPRFRADPLGANPPYGYRLRFKTFASARDGRCHSRQTMKDDEKPDGSRRCG